VQDLQGKAERVKPTDILQRLLDVHAEKSAFRWHHVATAAVAGPYDINNAYQYVIAREDQHLTWLADAIRGMGGLVPAATEVDALPAVKGDEALRRLVASDADALDAFVAAWKPRAEEITNARHKLMLTIMLGEMVEQARLFHQAAGGSLDILGRRTGGARLPGAVLPTRWVE
jgi:hypothetical protein